MFMKLHSCKLAFAAALASAVLYGLCTAMMYWWPAHALQMKADLLHMRNADLFSPYIQITLKNFLCGLIQVFVSSFIFFYLTALLYRLFSCCGMSGCQTKCGSGCGCKCGHAGPCNSGSCGCRCNHSGPCTGH
jgi:hypothetical protein